MLESRERQLRKLINKYSNKLEDGFIFFDTQSQPPAMLSDVDNLLIEIDNVYEKNL